MLDGLFTLLALSTVMAVASFFTGSLPLSFSLSQWQLRLISTIGMGVLVGTSLIVIIPEGVETLYSASLTTHTHQRRHTLAVPLDIRWSKNELEKRGAYHTPPLEGHWRRDNVADDAFHGMPGPVIPADVTLRADQDTTSPAQPLQTPARHPGLISPGANPDDHSHEDASEERLHKRSPHAWIGLSLILGFILMYLIDQIPRHASSQSNTIRQPTYIALDNLGRPHRSSSPSRDVESDSFIESSAPLPSHSLSTTTGLVIHAAADGIALGASSSTSNTSLSFIIFVAIMVHKAPAAFGLTSVLLKQGLTKRAARGHLIVFSLAAPIGAITTWVVVSALGGSREGAEEHTKWWVGITLLFSAGTFLYVAMHAMQEDDASHQETYSNGYAAEGHAGHAPPKQGPTMSLTLAAVAGMLLPLLTQFGHHH
ncbi:hypothetical protein MMC16_004032 [Acarospora aff. strigata]|nr:hypothetical protein [Acarospora aff. strigata]